MIFRDAEQCVIFFVKGALFRVKGSSPILEEPARHRPRQGRGFVRPPVSRSVFIGVQKFSQLDNNRLYVTFRLFH